MIEFLPSKNIPNRPLSVRIADCVFPFARPREVLVKAMQLAETKWEVWFYKLKWWQSLPDVEIVQHNGLHILAKNFWHYPFVYSSLIVSDEHGTDELTDQVRVVALAFLDRDVHWRTEELYTTVRRVFWLPVHQYDASLLPPPENPRGGAIRLKAFPVSCEIENEAFRKRIAARNAGLVRNPDYSATWHPELPEYVTPAQAAFNSHPANRGK